MMSANAIQSLDVASLGTGKPLLVAVHGIQGTRVAWVPVATELAANMTVMLPNLRGRGDARRGIGSKDYSLDGYAADLHDIVRSEVSEQPFVLAGWSMGVSVALEYLRRAGAPKPKALILLSGSPWLAATRWFEGEGPALLANVAAREQRLGLLEAAEHNAVAWTWEAIRHSDQRSALQYADLPTLVLHGSADEDSPWQHGALLAEGIEGAELVTLEGAGHNLLSQNTESVVSAMRRFITQVSAPKSLRQ